MPSGQKMQVRNVKKFILQRKSPHFGVLYKAPSPFPLFSVRIPWLFPAPPLGPGLRGARSGHFFPTGEEVPKRVPKIGKSAFTFFLHCVKMYVVKVGFLMDTLLWPIAQILDQIQLFFCVFNQQAAVLPPLVKNRRKSQIVGVFAHNPFHGGIYLWLKKSNLPKPSFGTPTSL